MQIQPKGPATAPPEPTFTGEVLIKGFVQRETPSRLTGATVSFAPGARTPWKVNPVGQTLIVLEGEGWAQCEGEDIVEIYAGDVLWCPPGIRHWDGATSHSTMTYYAIHEGDVHFLDRVTDEQVPR